MRPFIRIRFMRRRITSRANCPPPVDSTAPKLKQIRPGIQFPDSLYVARDTTKGDIDTIVRYTARDSTVFDIPRKQMTLVNNGIVEFENRELDAYTIVMDFQHSLMTSYSYDVDSVMAAALSLRRHILAIPTARKRVARQS